MYFLLLILQSIAAGSGTSNFLRAFLNSFFKLVIRWINEVNTAQSSNIVKLRFFDSPLLFFLFVALLLTCLSIISGHKWSGLDVVCFFVNRSPDHVFPSGGLSSNMVNRVNPVHESARPRFPSIFQQSSMRRSSITSKLVPVALVTTTYRSGIGNDSSLGTYSLTLRST